MLLVTYVRRLREKKLRVNMTTKKKWYCALWSCMVKDKDSTCDNSEEWTVKMNRRGLCHIKLRRPLLMYF